MRQDRQRRLGSQHQGDATRVRHVGLDPRCHLGVSSLDRGGPVRGSSVFWSCDGPTASILIGSDDETWDVALVVAVDVIDRIVELVGDL